MAILVPGGAGYIGSHTVYELIEQGRDVVVVDNLATGHNEAVHPKAKFYEGDIRDDAFLDTVLSEYPIDAVVHFAASSQVAESVAAPLSYYNNNLYGAMVLLQAMLRRGVGKIVFSSTAAVYGEPERIPIPEDARTEPGNPYGETKLAMERMFRWAAGANDLRYVPLRYFNACGARADGKIGEDHVPETHLVPIVMQVANGTRQFIAIYGDDYDTPDGTCVRDYIHVVDLAKAHVKALEYLERGGASDVFNLGNGSGFSVMEIVEAAREATGRPIPFVIAPRRAGDPAQLVASNRKAGEILGFRPEHPELLDILSSAWRWHQSHPRGFVGG